MKEKLNDRLAASAKPGVYFDTDKKSPRGFMLRVSPGGARAWCLNYRTRETGRERRLTIGDTAAWPIMAARERAAALRRIVDEGGDPLADLEQKRAAPTVAELAERFLADVVTVRSQRTGKKYAEGTQTDYRAILRDWVLPAMGKMKVAAVTREDVEKLHNKVSAAGKMRRANAVKSLISTMYTQAIDWKLCDDNPAKNVKNNPEIERDRYLTEEELARLLEVLDRWRPRRPDHVDIIMLALLTGSRRGEILSMCWEDVNLEAGTWTKPDTKQGKRHHIVLSDEAAAVLRNRIEGKVVPLRKERTPVFFRGTGNRKTQANALERDWYQIRAAAGIEDVRFHDMRHSFASFLVSRGQTLKVVGDMLGHAKPQTTQRYAHLSNAAQREAAAIVGKIVGGGSTGRS
jgi:integrase